ncbi:hypothetical protein FBQ97_07310 [Acidobacteria bacterium ACD]|nr:MAG: hypothetical protein EDX89_20910 [Acidobacteriota bacterium]MDL1949606.1 hypothetical protein [Acidobacteria bacterium ACD]
MKSHTTAAFRRAFAALPAGVRAQARRAYVQFRFNPRHPGLRFKPVHATRPIYSVRVGLHFRAPGVVAGDEIVWFWIGSHDDYERLVGQR